MNHFRSPVKISILLPETKFEELGPKNDPNSIISLLGYLTVEIRHKLKNSLPIKPPFSEPTSKETFQHDSRHRFRRHINHINLNDLAILIF